MIQQLYLYLCTRIEIIMRKIITYGGFFEAFMSSLSDKERRKVD